ncbi:MAG: serine/threonine protein kinase [Labilithrix sp.]|nr:serine/threonine protein kinase [Labilithrix sp.]
MDGPPDKSEKPQPLPSTIPDRKRPDATIVVAPGTVPIASDSAGAIPSGTAAPDSYTIDDILAEIRRTPSERLHIEARAASGGMGSIDVAVDRALDRRIALKTLHPHLRSSEGAVRMFLREARLTGLLDHPHIVPVYDIGERDASRLYFSMKLVEGQTLGDIIRALPRGPLDTATLYTLLDTMTKVCDALAFAHSRGVLHCDIKPPNVMVGEFGQVYLMDWGIARLVAAESSPASGADPQAARGAMPAAASATDNSVIGTPCYMSPEQARGDRGKLDVRSDVFLLGSVLYEILTRRPPYASSDRTETLSLAVAGAFPAPRKIAKDGSVPPELERIVLRAMAKDPSDRYPSVAALREDLSRFMRGGGDFPRKTFDAGATIVREGEQGDAAYIIVAGRCDIRKDLPSGTETLTSIGPGAVFGEMAIMTEGPRTATVVATERTTVLVVTPAILEQEMDALKPWVATLLKSLAARFRDIDTKHRATYSAGPSPARLANQVLMIVSAWGDADDDGGRSMKWTVLGAELEAQLGVPPIAMFGVATRYGMVLDMESDRLTIPDVADLREKLRVELGL